MLTDFGHLAPSFYLHPFTFLLLPSSLLTGLTYVFGPRNNHIKKPQNNLSFWGFWLQRIKLLRYQAFHSSFE